MPLKSLTLSGICSSTKYNKDQSNGTNGFRTDTAVAPSKSGLLCRPHFLTVSYWCNYRQKYFLITYKVMAD